MMSNYNHNIKGTSTDPHIATYDVRAGDVFFGPSSYVGNRYKIVTIISHEESGSSFVHEFNLLDKSSELKNVDYAFFVMNWIKL